MLMRIITLRFSTTLDGFDDAPLTEFIRDKAVLRLREHFFMRNETPYLAIAVTYEPQQQPPPPKDKTKARQRNESWRELLQDADMPLFDALRDWRSERCKSDGIPPYVICNNKQLARIAVTRPQALSALRQIDGFGKAKADKYAREIIEVVKPSEEDSDERAKDDDETG